MTAIHRVGQDPRANNFDLLRIGAAIAVLVSHAFVLSGRPEPQAPGGISLGAAGVLVFFSISGYLVTESWRRDPHLGRFGARRALRIFPGLVCVLLLTGLVLGPLATNLSLHDYLLHASTRSYLVDNLMMVRMHYGLPGVFGDVPFPGSVNGSLWSLRPELHAYVAVAALGAAGVLASRRVATAAALAAAVLLVGMGGTIATAFGEPAPLLGFLAGVLLLLWRDELPWRWPIAAALMVLAWALPPAPATDAVVGLAYAYTVLMLGCATPAVGPRLLRGHDLSYGTYLWAFPVQQTVAAVIAGVSVAAMISISLPVTLVLAALSWRLVEAPVLRLKRRLRRRGQPAGAAAVAVTT